MGMLDAFFKDSGYGNYYQGTAKNTSGQLYDPTAYNNQGVFNPKDTLNTKNINPISFGDSKPQPGNYTQGPSLGTIFGPAPSRTYFNTQQPSAAKWKNDAGFQSWLSQLFSGGGVF